MGAVLGAFLLAPGAGPGAGAEVVPGDGMATHYDSVDGGNCSFTGPPDDHLDVALSEVEYGTADACGAYLDVTGPDGTVRVKVTNRCPECQVGHLDLSTTAFARIAPLEAGQVDVSYQLVRNPPVPGPITLRVKEGSSRWWLQIQADDHGNPLASFELQTDTGWRSLVHTQDNFWMAEEPGPGDGPFTVRLTDVLGQSVTIDGIDLVPGQVQTTDARLYGAGAAPPPPPGGAPTTTGPAVTTTTAPAPTTAPASTTTALFEVAGAAGESTDGPDTRRASSPGAGDASGSSAELLLAGGAAVLAAAGAAVFATRRPDDPDHLDGVDGVDRVGGPGGQPGITPESSTARHPSSNSV